MSSIEVKIPQHQVICCDSPITDKLAAETEKTHKLELEFMFKLGMKFNTLLIKKQTFESDLQLHQKQFEHLPILYREQWKAHIALARQVSAEINTLFQDLIFHLNRYRDQRPLQSYAYHPHMVESMDYSTTSFDVNMVKPIPSTYILELNCIKNIIDFIEAPLSDDDTTITERTPELTSTPIPSNVDIPSIGRTIPLIEENIASINKQITYISKNIKYIEGQYYSKKCLWNQNMEQLIVSAREHLLPISEHIISLKEYYNKYKELVDEDTKSKISDESCTRGHFRRMQRNIRQLKETFKVPVKMATEMEAIYNKIIELSQKLLFKAQTQESN